MGGWAGELKTHLLRLGSVPSTRTPPSFPGGQNGRVEPPHRDQSMAHFEASEKTFSGDRADTMLHVRLKQE